MPTNDERREVAARLREHIGKPLFTGQDVEDIIGVQRSDFDVVLADASYRRLADLIEPEERTCHDVSFDSREFVCSWCGCHIDVLDIESEPTMWLGGSPIEPSFCPNCGAMVVDADA